MDCPASALELFTLDKAAHRFVLSYDAARCTFCGQCVESCNFGALQQVNDEWELAGPNRSAFIAYYGAEDDVRQVLAGKPAAAAQPERA
jgi:formate hydrogenlyase subunit 6/NADH:ubiquinone oxidoreductase subunit I